MYSKSFRYATVVLAVVLASFLALGCTTTMPWNKAPDNVERNLAFTIQNNLVILSAVTVDGRPGRFLLGTSAPRSVLDPSLRVAAGTHVLDLSQRDAIRFDAEALPLSGIAEGIIGADVWHGRTITIDYHAGLVTYQQEGMHAEQMAVFAFTGPPALPVTVDGTTWNAIVDTTSPDTLVLPRPAAPSRAKAQVSVAGTNFGAVDVRYANVSAPRIGNRLLSKFLVSIDYGRGRVAVWRDPRN